MGDYQLPESKANRLSRTLDNAADLQQGKDK
jgi:hypothetical protein